MRVDANISLRPRGSDALNTKVEVKNMNSIRHVGDAIAHEIQRQTERLGAGGTIVLHTRLWDPVRGVTVPMRGKFSGPCVPDPSVPEIVLSQEWLTRMRGRLPEMPEAKRDRFMTQYGLGRDEAILMSSERDLADYFESAARLCAPALAASWIAGQLLPALKERAEMPGKTPVTPQRLAGLLNMVDCGELSTGAAREVFALLFDSADTPAQLVDRGSFRQISDTAEIGAVVDQVLSAHPDAVGDYRSGKKQALSFLVGQVIRASKGKANPKIARELLGVKLA
jgi:aspartyl-tRNA(Asn)/glutamyl-tRNA(Gln) amidotransferase subunit B